MKIKTFWDKVKKSDENAVFRICFDDGDKGYLCNSTGIAKCDLEDWVRLYIYKDVNCTESAYGGDVVVEISSITRMTVKYIS